MNMYICDECGRRCFSAADPAYLKDDACPYCGGHVVPAGPAVGWAWEADERDVKIKTGP